MIIKAISLRQPFADLVATGLKTIETRKWQTPYRGPLLICASAGPNIPAPGYEIGNDLARGVALCIVDLYDCRPMTKDDEFFACCKVYPKAKAWLLGNRRIIKPFPVKGALYLFDVEVSEIPA